MLVSQALSWDSRCAVSRLSAFSGSHWRSEAQQPHSAIPAHGLEGRSFKHLANCQLNLGLHCLANILPASTPRRKEKRIRLHLLSSEFVGSDNIVFLALPWPECFLSACLDLNDLATLLFSLFNTDAVPHRSWGIRLRINGS